MHQARVDLDFATKALGQIGSLPQVRQQHLHGVDAVGDQVADLVNRSHSSGPNRSTTW